jgi:ATP-dependent Clp protease adaptor protein ClpS
MEWEGTSNVIEQTDTKNQEDILEPHMFKVIMLNDHYTTMDFVVYVLETVFHKNLMEAIVIMLSIHNEGAGICGVYTAEVAETKIQQVHQLAREKEFPLRCTMEEE